MGQEGDANAARIEVRAQEDKATHAVKLQALALFAQRASAHYEWTFAPHHALTAGLFLQATGWIIPELGDAMACAGGEIGYRWYLAPDMTRWFVGSSLFGGRYFYAKTLRVRDLWEGDLSTKGAGWFNSWGAAIDVGYQYRFSNGGMVSGALGAQYNYATRGEGEMTKIAYVFAGDGIRPRILLEVGVAF